MSAVVFHRLSDRALADAWDELAETRAAPPFARHTWFRALSEAYGMPIEVATRGSAVLDAVAPVVRSRGWISAAVNEQSPDFCLLASSPGAAASLVSELARRASLRLPKVGPGDVDLIRRAATSLSVEEEVMERSPYIEITGDWSSFEASLRSKFVKDLKRRQRRLEEQGEVEMRRYEAPAEVPEALRAAFAIEERQWKGAAGTAMGSSRETATFYDSIARWCAERGWLRLWLHHVDGAATAFALDLLAYDTYYGLKVGYDPAFARLSPAMLLQHETVRYAFDRAARRFEFLGADEAYKLNWTGTCRDRLVVRVYRRGVRGALARAARRYAVPALRTLRNARGR